ncbi:mandelate racemase/muconate lactonizing enzyme family protein [Pedobacter alpinus]|uniref:Dipeptide epimerase n=1 Tax=Pedobacter alpinus TaxID=1590643 RepID=A0ABW5TSW7_9SPHI
MIITHTEIYRFSIPMEPFTIATGTMHFAQNIFIRIYTDAGIYGVGEGSAFPMIVGETQETMIKIAQDFAKIWKGKNPLAIDERMAELTAYSGSFNATCKSAFDMALYDIAAKDAGLPLYQFLGGEKREVITDMTLGIDTPEAMAAKALEHVKNGCTIIKIKLGKGVDADIERVKQIRAAVRNTIKIRLDANQGWSFEEAVYALTALEKFDIEFCEQPMRTWYDDFLPELLKLSPIKITADESCFNHHDARKLIKNNACDYINIKFAKSGGINEGLKIYNEAIMHNIPCMIGSMLESRIALSANLHFALACDKIKFFDLDTCLLGHLVDPVIGGLTYKGFELFVSDEIGIGADANDSFLKDCEKIVI